MRAIFDSAEARGAALKFGADEGGKQTLARLEQQLAAMKSAA